MFKVIPFTLLLTTAVLGADKPKAFCIEMTTAAGGMGIVACSLGKKMKVEMGKQPNPGGGFIVDLESETQWLFNDESHEYVSFTIKEFQALSKKNPAAIKAAEKDLRERGKRLASVQVKEQKKAAAKGEDCRWFALESGKESVLQICIRKYPAPATKGYAELIGLVREYNARAFPAELNGVPIPNLDLPIFKADGVVESGSLPVIIKSNQDANRFRYFERELDDPKSYFSLPKGYAKKEMPK